MKWLISLFFVSISFTNLCLGQSQSPFSELKRGSTQQLDSLFEYMYAQSQFNGNVLIADKNGILFNKSLGIRNLEGDSLNLETTFELASVTKQFTSAAIMLLVDQDKLSLSDPISRHLTELSFYEEVSVRNLLNHTSGFDDYMNVFEIYWDKTKTVTNQDVIDFFGRLNPSLNFQPGEKKSYCNTNYVFLASIIERISKQTYEEFLQTYIFEPLSMDRTMVYRRSYQPQVVENTASPYFYRWDTKELVSPYDLETPTEAVYLDGVVGDGSVISNIYDLLKWHQALSEGKILSQAIQEEMFSPQMLEDSSYSDYGLGWYVRDNLVYGKIVKHSGSWEGFLTYFERHLESEVAIIVLMNIARGDDKLPTNTIRKLVYGIPAHAYIDLREDQLLQYAGTYVSSTSGRDILFEVIDGKLFLNHSEYFQFELKPISVNKFVAEGYTPEVFYEFISDERGELKYILTRPETGLVVEGSKKRK